MGEFDGLAGLCLGVDCVVELLLRDCSLEDIQRNLVYDEVIRCHLARNHRFAETEVGVDNDQRTVTVSRIHGEHHPRREGIGHFLHADADRYMLVVEVLVGPVSNSPPRVKAGDATADVVQDLIHTADPEVGILLPGETRSGKVLGRGARAYRYRSRRQTAAHRELAVVLGHQILHFSGEGLGLDHLANRLTDFFQGVHILGIETCQQRLYFPTVPRLGHETPVAFGGHGEAGRNPDASIDQFAERRAFHPDQGDRIFPAVFEPAD